ncbi:MAG: hypothetical protein R3F54_21850, partial [Alphaproteobacteria bacterium]
IEIHHVPSDAAVDYLRDDIPAIVMRKADHKATGSKGSSSYVGAERAIDDFEDQFHNAYGDVKNALGSSYDEAFAQAYEYWKSTTW